jgi:CxxC motif-containing protein (DUF1111 family)
MFKYLSFLNILLSIACNSLDTEAPKSENILDGPVEGLTFEQNIRFIAGDRAFNNEIFTIETGLGPLFVANSCKSCHAGDGKGHPFSTLTRFGQSDSSGNLFLHSGGPQLQNRAIPGYQPEELPGNAPSARFTPPANTGLGFLAALSDEQILTHADPYDQDHNGISGVPNLIIPPPYFIPGKDRESINGKYIGRFGKKASAVDLLHQVVNAYNQDIGITSSFNPVDVYTGLITNPEVPDETINNLVFYLRTLKAPVQRSADDPDVRNGKQIFMDIGCTLCHIPDWTTPVSDIKELSRKIFHPYTDLLLHDLGPGLDDGYTEGTALTSEWRTPPLWGLGLSPNSQGGRYYLLHDGRARSIEDAILFHGGEGSRAREEYSKLSVEEKVKLIRFMESL